MTEQEKLIFKENSIFEYNNLRKELIGIIQIIVYTILVLLVLSYFIFFKNSDFFIFQGVRYFVTAIYTQIQAGTLLGSFYTACFGGLFFIFLPNEIIFTTFLGKNNPYLILLIFLIGLSCSYWANYYIGLKFAKVVKHIIKAENFYKTKGIINKYGKAAIFLFNVTPLPSQQLTAVLGVFKYNKARFYTFFLAGQTIKYILIILVGSAII